MGFSTPESWGSVRPVDITSKGVAALKNRPNPDATTRRVCRSKREPVRGTPSSIILGASVLVKSYRANASSLTHRQALWEESWGFLCTIFLVQRRV